MPSIFSAGFKMKNMEATWEPCEIPGRLAMQSDRPDTVLAFPKQRKEPNPQRVRNAVSCIAPDDDRPPQMSHRFWVFPLVFIPWLLLYEFVVYRGPASSAFTTYLPGELGWPIWQPMEMFYVSAYLLVTLAPLAAPTNRVLRRFTVGGLLSIVLGNLIFLGIPAIAPPRPFQPSGLLGWMMVLDRNLDLNNGTASFPSFHVVWSFLGAAVFVRRWPCMRRLCWVWAVLVSASCILTGMHSLADVVAGFLLFVAIHHYPTICNFVKPIKAEILAMRSEHNFKLWTNL